MLHLQTKESIVWTETSTQIMVGKTKQLPSKP